MLLRAVFICLEVRLLVSFRGEEGDKSNETGRGKERREVEEKKRET